METQERSQQTEHVTFHLPKAKTSIAAAPKISGQHTGLPPEPRKPFVLVPLAAGKGFFPSVGLVKFLALPGESKETVPTKRHCPTNSPHTC